MNYTLEEIIELAKEVETTDAIEWDDLPLDKDRIYHLVGSQAYDLYKQHANTNNGEAIIVATITKLLVENFVLNLRVESR